MLRLLFIFFSTPTFAHSSQPLGFYSQPPYSPWCTVYPPLPYKVCLFKGYDNKVINAAVDFSAKRRKTTRRKTPKKREAQFFFSFLISQKKGLKTSKTSLNCTHWLLLLVSLLGITRQFQRWCWYWWRFVCLMLNPQPHPCCLWSPIVDSQKWGCESEFLSYKVFSSRKSKHNIPSSGLLWNHSTKDTSQRGPLSLFID